MKKVLVTGANGFLGSHLAEELLKKGYQVFGLIFGDAQKIKHLRGFKNFKPLVGDMTDFRKMLTLFKKYRPECVFHTAALHSPVEIDSPFPFFEPNVRGTLNLLEACRISKVKSFVYSSSMSVYGKADYLPVDEEHLTRPHDFYSLTKFLGEECCRLYAKKYGLRVIILRYVGIYGLRRDWGAITNFIRNALKNKPLSILNNINWDIVYVKDICRANIAALEKAKAGFELINIGSGQEVNIKDVARQIKKMSGSKSKIKIGKRALGPVSSHFYFDIKRAKRLLGFKPSSFQKTVSQYIKELKKQ
ncbi:MAG: hypothetical protein CMI54_03635 [Parcubacteria group bacterium]|nr:hypothetical protein [Parcubacteria group bacterium]|tara:strand:- start:12211 stop:13122 length:912 start_codon:yes stop_codon:yes gene_type:complete